MNEKKLTDIMITEGFTWEDLTIFLMDDYLVKMIDEMVEQSALPEIDGNTKFELKNFIEEKVRTAIGR